MATSTALAYNTGSTITGTQQIGSLAVVTASTANASSSPNGVKFWMGPDEDLGYVVALPEPLGNISSPTGQNAFLSFIRSNFLTQSSFLTMVNGVFNQSFTTGEDAKTYLNNNGYWTSFTGPPITIVTQFLTDSGSFVVPPDITTFYSILVGGGGGGAGSEGDRNEGNGGGGGGALSYGTYTVTPLETLTYSIGIAGNAGGTGANGGNGGTSSISRGGTTLLSAGGGNGGTFRSTASANGGTSGGTERDGGGNGGAGGGATGNNTGGGGGGAGGYSGDGGAGGGTGSGSNGSGGGGGGGGATDSGQGYSGGGVGLDGEGTSGTGGSLNQNGTGGSGGNNGTQTAGGTYGGGGGARDDDSAGSGVAGGVGGGKIIYTAQTGVEWYTINSVLTTWTVPAGVSSITVHLWGGGGGGAGTSVAASAGGGGGGGGYARKTITTSGGTQYKFVVGNGGDGTTGAIGAINGAGTVFYNAAEVEIFSVSGGQGGAANNGAGGTGGSGTNGDVNYNGGTGGTGASGASGGGGGGAGTTGNGGSASGTVAGTGTTLYGGNGGTGVSTITGNAGNVFGGGGSGGARVGGTNGTGASGAQGAILIEIVEEAVTPTPTVSPTPTPTPTPTPSPIPASPPVFEAGSTSTSSANSFSVNAPSGVVDGDLLVTVIDFEKGSTEVINTLAGWTALTRTNNSTNAGQAIYYKVASSEPASYTWTITQGSKTCIGVARISNASSLNIITSASTGSGTAVTAPSLNTVVDNCLILAFYTNKSSGTYTGVSTERWDAPNTGGGLPSNMLATFVKATSGATGNQTATVTVSESWVATQVAIRPA